MRWGAALAVIAALSAGAWAQSLEELAQKEKARRKRTAEAKTFTNDDLSKPSPSPSPSPGNEGQAGPGKGSRPRMYQPANEGAGRGSKESGGGQAAEGQRAKEGGSEESVPSVDEAGAQAYWRGRAQALRDATAKARETISTLEARAGQLRLDRDPNPPDQFDPNRLQKRQAELQTTLAELDKARASVNESQQQLQALEDEARLKGIPLSWVQ
jgi:hypothetical protein